MSDGDFNNNRFEPGHERSAIVNFILKLGIVRDETQAKHVEIGFIIIALAATIYLYSSMGSGSLPSKSEMDKIPLPGSGISLE